MATRADRSKAEAQVENSRTRRVHAPVPRNNKARFRAGQAASKKGRALHAPTKLQADAKAGKPDPGKVSAFWKTGVNGGEDQTVNAVAVGRGADGPARTSKTSRKSTRGEWPGGEKDAQLPRVVRRRTHSPENRALRGK